MIIWYKDNVAFIYIKMNPLQLRKEVEEEMKRTRIDKTRLYDLLLKIVDSTVGGEASAGPAGERGPAGPAGPAGERGPAGPAGECKCKCTKEEAPKKTTTTSTKKKSATATTKKTTE